MLDEVTETVFSVLSVQDSPVATKNEELCWQDKLRAAANASTSVRCWHGCQAGHSA